MYRYICISDNFESYTFYKIAPSVSLKIIMYLIYLNILLIELLYLKIL